jgi:hypothetical protein
MTDASNTKPAQADRKPRTKAAGPRAFIITAVAGKERCVTAMDVRVASQQDLMRALSGEIPTDRAPV